LFGSSHPRRDRSPTPSNPRGSAHQGLIPAQLELRVRLRPMGIPARPNPLRYRPFHPGKNNRHPPRGKYPQSFFLLVDPTPSERWRRSATPARLNPPSTRRKTSPAAQSNTSPLRSGGAQIPGSQPRRRRAVQRRLPLRRARARPIRRRDAVEAVDLSA
jgi:hypothetical protein